MIFRYGLLLAIRFCSSSMNCLASRNFCGRGAAYRDGEVNEVILEISSLLLSCVRSPPPMALFYMSIDEDLL